MASSSDNVRVAVTGAVYSGPTSATAPTGTASAIADLDDLGFVSEDGITVSFPESGDAEPIKAWQNGATVRTVRSTSDDVPTISLTLIETKLEVIETVFGVSVTQTATEGSFELDTSTTREPQSFVVDVVDGDELIRVYVPRGVVSAVGDLSLTSTDAIGYEVTIDCERASAGYNLKTWMTALQTAA